MPQGVESLLKDPSSLSKYCEVSVITHLITRHSAPRQLSTLPLGVLTHLPTYLDISFAPAAHAALSLSINNPSAFRASTPQLTIADGTFV